MKSCACVVLLPIFLSLLFSSTYALTCISCIWEQENPGKNVDCPFGGHPGQASNRSAKLDVLEAIPGPDLVEACLTFYGVYPETGYYYVYRGNVSTISAQIGKCTQDPATLNFYCYCNNTDNCNTVVPPGILKCHFCLHTARKPAPGCISGADTVQTYLRSAGGTNEENPVTSRVYTAATELHRSSQRAARQNPELPNKYQKCITFQGSENGVETFYRGKTYIPRDFNGCLEIPQDLNTGIDGTYCYCSDDLCNSLPGKAGRMLDRGLGCSVVSMLMLMASFQK